MAKAKPPKDLSFEQAVDELETLIEAIEAGEIGLEEVLQRYERGVGLIQRCREVLTGAEARLKKLNLDQLTEGEDEDLPEPDEA